MTNVPITEDMKHDVFLAGDDMYIKQKYYLFEKVFEAIKNNIANNKNLFFRVPRDKISLIFSNIDID
jgi:hypothetical protein